MPGTDAYFWSLSAFFVSIQPAVSRSLYAQSDLNRDLLWANRYNPYHLFRFIRIWVFIFPYVPSSLLLAASLDQLIIQRFSR